MSCSNEATVGLSGASEDPHLQCMKRLASTSESYIRHDSATEWALTIGIFDLKSVLKRTHHKNKYDSLRCQWLYVSIYVSICMYDVCWSMITANIDSLPLLAYWNSALSYSSQQKLLNSVPKHTHHIDRFCRKSSRTRLFRWEVYGFVTSIASVGSLISNSNPDHLLPSPLVSVFPTAKPSQSFSQQGSPHWIFLGGKIWSMNAESVYQEASKTFTILVWKPYISIEYSTRIYLSLILRMDLKTWFCSQAHSSQPQERALLVGICVEAFNW